uniref:Uncharacterized protein n=1 Tax=Romanomermis culicivorax TaxID=13658 RepID=A0A915K4X2_ROMCU
MSRCRMFYPPTQPIQFIPPSRKSPFPAIIGDKACNSFKTAHHPEGALEEEKETNDEWNKLPDISDDEDRALQPQSIFDDAKCLQAAIISTMKSNLTNRIIQILNFAVSPMYKLAIRDRLQYDDRTLPPIPHEVDDVWIKRRAADQPLREQTYQ